MNEFVAGLLTLALHLLLVLEVQFSNLSVSRLKVVAQLITLLFLPQQSRAHIYELFEKLKIALVQIGKFLKLSIGALFYGSDHTCQVLRSCWLLVGTLFKLIRPDLFDLLINHLNNLLEGFFGLALAL